MSEFIRRSEGPCARVAAVRRGDEFTIRSRRCDLIEVVVEVVGELDFATAPTLELALQPSQGRHGNLYIESSRQRPDRIGRPPA